MNPVRFLTVLAALGLLVAVFAASGPAMVQAAEVSLDDDEDVAWAANDGEDISFTKAGSNVRFLIKDSALEMKRTGKATLNIPSTMTTVTKVNVALGTAEGAGTGTVTRKLFGTEDDDDDTSAVGYNGWDGATSTATMFTGTGAATTSPLDADFLKTRVGGLFPSSIQPNGELTPVTPLSQPAANQPWTVDVIFVFHIRDKYTGWILDLQDPIADDPATPADETTATTTDPTGLRRAKVTSQSDSQGEWVTIEEVKSATAQDEGSATSQIFMGEVRIDTNPALAGSAGFCSEKRKVHDTSAGTGPCDDDQVHESGWSDGGVWVQDGDILTVTYYDTDSSTINGSDTVTVDTVAPQITNISPVAGAFTRIANPTLSFDVLDSGSEIDITKTSSVEVFINPSLTTLTADSTAADVKAKLDSSGNSGKKAANVSFQGLTGGVRVLFAQGTAWRSLFQTDRDDLGEFPIVIRATDKAGNVSTYPANPGDPDTQHTLDIDLERPEVRTAKTGTPTEVTVTFSEVIDPASVDADGSDFTVTEATIAAAEVIADDEDTAAREDVDVKLTLNDPGLDPDAKPVVKVISDILDRAGNEVDTANNSASQVTAADKTPPTITGITIDRDLVVKDDKVKTTITFDEKLSTTGVKVSVVGSKVTEANKFSAGRSLNVSRPTPLQAEATFTVKTSTLDPTGAYGVSIQITDLGNVSKDNLVDITDEEPSISDAKVLTVDFGPLGDVDFNYKMTAGRNVPGTGVDLGKMVFQAGDVLVYDSSVTDNADTKIDERIENITVTGVNASARTITVEYPTTGDDAVDPDNIRVNYSHVGDNWFQVDHSAPTVTFDPENKDKVQSQNPFVRITFDEDEYPGDGYKTVTLDKAELTGPDGETTDLKEAFIAGSSDSIEFIWQGSGLALGKYELKVSATDTAGNQLKDSKSEFTIEKRVHKMSLRPGWNLVSLPDDPPALERGVNDVITSDLVTRVLNYDARERNWFRATRQDDGTLGQPGSALELTQLTANTAYWIYANGVVTVTVDVPGTSAGAGILPSTISLVRGWNMVPVRVQDLSETKIDPDTYFSGLKWSRAYGYNNVSQRFVSLLPDAANENVGDNDTVSVGNGYWVYLTEAGVLVP